MFALEMKDDLKIAMYQRAAKIGSWGLEEGINLARRSEATSGKDQAYWLLSVKAAGPHCLLYTSPASSGCTSTQSSQPRGG